VPQEVHSIFVLYITLFSPFLSVHTVCNLNYHPFLPLMHVCSKSFGLMLGGQSYSRNQREHITRHLTLGARNPYWFTSLTSTNKPLLSFQPMSSWEVSLFFYCVVVCVAVIQKITHQLNLIHSLCLLTGQIINYQL